MVAVAAQGEFLTGLYSPDVHRTASLPRGWHRLNRHDGLDNGTEYCSLGVTASTPCSPRATLDRRGSTGKQGFFLHKKGAIPPLPPIRKSSLDQRNRATSPLHLAGLGVSAAVDETGGGGTSSRQRGSSIDSSRLFSAKLEQLANRTNSLGRVHTASGGAHHYDCFSLERDGSLRWGGSGGAKGDSTMPRTGRSLSRAGSVSSSSSAVHAQGPSSAPQSPSKTSSGSKMSAVSKLLMTSSPKGRSLSASSTKTLSFSTKSLSQVSSRSSSLPPNGKVKGFSSVTVCGVKSDVSDPLVLPNPELCPDLSTAAAGALRRLLVHTVFEPQSGRQPGKSGRQAAPPGRQRSDLGAPPEQRRLPFQESLPGRWRRRGRGERRRAGEVRRLCVASFKKEEQLSIITISTAPFP